MGVVNPDAISFQINSFPFYLFFLLKIKLTLVRGKEAMVNHRWCQNLVSECVANILTTLKGLLWFFFTVQTHSNEESICFNCKKQNFDIAVTLKLE